MSDLPVVSITHEQARKAFSIIYGIIGDVFPDLDRPTATQVNIHPSLVEEMRKLVIEARQNHE